jgi:hypothetical protein
MISLHKFDVANNFPLLHSMILENVIGSSVRNISYLEDSQYIIATDWKDCIFYLRHDGVQLVQPRTVARVGGSSYDQSNGERKGINSMFVGS